MTWLHLSLHEKGRYFVNEYHRIREHTTALCTNLKAEDYTVQPSCDVSPPKWHLGHTTWFFEELILVKNLPGYVRFDEQYRYLFNSYYKSAGEHWLQSHRGDLSRPAVDEIKRYRGYVDKHIQILLSQDLVNESLYSLLEIGLHHEQQHQELLMMDIKYIFGCNPLALTYSNSHFECAQVGESQWCSFTEGIYEIGAGGEGFAYDNEKPRHKSYSYPFIIADNTVTNGEYLSFIEAGGYDRAEFWLSLGWDWLKHNGIKSPLYWREIEGQWYEFTLYGLMKLDLNAPVTHVSYFEADAYANWAGMRLPTEQELEIYMQVDSANLNKNIVKTEAIGQLIFHPNNSKARFGQIWCWSKSHYSGYPGYKPYQGMLTEYNGKFMCNQFVLKGGCVATPTGHYRHSYRNFYQPHQRWMFSGIRLAKDIE
ncbi:hypothetical protein N473_14020 [Pseudoalteromonas luteoviolacea CPMOR-1]|uniref:Sulfatase maturase n=1 Tax=Pseudoalteromonas luteoviolacea CPMOR-1 TaxID=1365248 RepID=A0A162B1D0_9GAMM|nr:ergothioneine biosynthesis protein EgtB [Pseudoalteromonas luteoviolacea]KZN64905.1 hypothetical protein N473_14020 [Pseudoalteromonas luteoviolacea CPMOR-1]